MTTLAAALMAMGALLLGALLLGAGTLGGALWPWRPAASPTPLLWAGTCCLVAGVWVIILTTTL